MTLDQVALLLQTALLGEVSPALRGVTVGVLGDRVSLVLYFDGPVSVEDRESASCVETELIASLPEALTVTSEVIRSDPPAQLVVLDRWVFRRRE